MTENNIEELISAMYDTIQNARSMPLAPDKCIVERDALLDMLDEISAQLPGELKQSRTIVESRNELINQARHESESIIRQAQEKAKQLVTQEAIYVETKNQCEEMVRQTQARVKELRRVSNEYMDEALRRTEEAIAQSLNEVRDTRVKFHAVTDAQDKRGE
jgi:DNA anti-recombination protein RmuC